MVQSQSFSSIFVLCAFVLGVAGKRSDSTTGAFVLSVAPRIPQAEAATEMNNCVQTDANCVEAHHGFPGILLAVLT